MDIKQRKVMDYDKIYIDIVHYLGENFEVTMAEAALHAEQLTEIVMEQVEEELTDEIT